jgi:hypothetical protein
VSASCFSQIVYEPQCEVSWRTPGLLATRGYRCMITVGWLHECRTLRAQECTVQRNRHATTALRTASCLLMHYSINMISNGEIPERIGSFPGNSTRGILLCALLVRKAPVRIAAKSHVQDLLLDFEHQKRSARARPDDQACPVLKACGPSLSLSLPLSLSLSLSLYIYI